MGKVKVLDMVFHTKTPRHAVCDLVLNLLTQGGPHLVSFALAYAYRVTRPKHKAHYLNCWLKTLSAASRTQQGIQFIS